MELLLIGDVMLGRLVNEKLYEASPEYPWGDTLTLIREADVRICNLECVLSDGGSPARKAFTFRSDAKNVAVLEAAGMNAVALANNHSLDYGPEALADTLGVLEQEGIRYAGAGRDLSRAQALARIMAGTATVGLLAVTDTNEPGWDAQRDRPGVWYVPIDTADERACALLDIVKKARREVDMLVVSLHWGTNWGYEPEAGHRDFAHTLIERGADVVFGHSAHVCRGVELYKSKPIVYSAGNFIDDYAVDEIERNDESFIFVIGRRGDSLRHIRMYPTIIENCQVRLAPADRAERIAARMKKLCRKLGTQAQWIAAKRALEIQV